MPVNVVENWSEIEGTIAGIEAGGNPPEYLAMTLDVTRAKPVPGYPNLFSWAVGQQVAVNVVASRVAELGLAPGAVVRCRVRRAGPTASFADPGSLVKIG